jgi:tetratricopeptide (TPR) repeat protein
MKNTGTRPRSLKSNERSTPMKRFRLMKLLPFMIFVLSLPVMSAVRGKVRVYVTDSQGKPLPGVKITLVSMRSSIIKHEIATNERGIATHASLENHNFEFTIEKEGYQTQKRMVKIPAGLLKKEDITLYTIEETIMQMESKDPYAQAINKYNQAVVFIKKEDYERALTLLEESISLDETIPQPHYEIGKILFTQEEYQEAIKSIEEAILLDEEYVPAYRLMAAIYEKLGDKKESEKYIKLAQKYGGTSGIDKYNEAVNCFNEGDMDSAIFLFEEALQLDAKLADAHYQLGLAYVNKGENERAISNFEKYLEIEPEGKNASTARSLLQFLQKQ